MDKVNITSYEQEKWELEKKIEEVENEQQECRNLIRRLDDLEDLFYRQNLHSKEQNDDLFNKYPDDMRLQSALLDREDVIKKSMAFEQSFFSDYRDAMSKKIMAAEQEKETLLGKISKVE